MTSDLDKARGGDLKSLLALCSKEDLGPLVDIILKRLSNDLNADQAYIKFKPDHTKYHEAIAKEIRSYGGHTFSNLYRGEGPPYGEILIDVCRRLGAPFQDDQNAVLSNERRLLEFLCESPWDGMSREERAVRAEKARKKIEETWFRPSALAGASAAPAFLLRSILTLPVAVATTVGATAFEPAFSVTAPCVVHIAYLRRKLLDTPNMRASSPASSNGRKSERKTTPPQDALVIQDEAGELLLSISEVQRPGEGPWTPISKGDDVVSRLNPLLQAVPSLATAAVVNSGGYMRVVCKGPLTPIAEGVCRPFSMEGGRISGQAKLFDPKALGRVANPSAFFAIASAAVAQQHLADISRKLSEIKEGVDAIRAHQKGERRSRILGAHDYYLEIAPPLLKGELSASVAHQLEAGYQGLLEVQRHLTEELKASVQALEGMQDREWMGSQGFFKDLKAKQRDIEILIEESFLCLRARALNWRLLCLFPDREDSKQERLKALRRTLEDLVRPEGLLSRSELALFDKSRDIQSFWNQGSTLNQRRLDILKRRDAMKTKASESRLFCEEELGSGGRMLEARAEETMMLLKIEDGRIIGIRPA